MHDLICEKLELDKCRDDNFTTTPHTEWQENVMPPGRAEEATKRDAGIAEKELQVPERSQGGSRRVTQVSLFLFLRVTQ